MDVGVANTCEASLSTWRCPRISALPSAELGVTCHSPVRTWPGISRHTRLCGSWKDPADEAKPPGQADPTAHPGGGIQLARRVASGALRQRRGHVAKLDRTREDRRWFVQQLDGKNLMATAVCTWATDDTLETRRSAKISSNPRGEAPCHSMSWWRCRDDCSRSGDAASIVDGQLRFSATAAHAGIRVRHSRDGRVVVHR